MTLRVRSFWLSSFLLPLAASSALAAPVPRGSMFAKMVLIATAMIPSVTGMQSHEVSMTKLGRRQTISYVVKAEQQTSVRGARTPTKQTARPATKVGRLMAALGVPARADINAAQPTTPEGTYALVPNGVAFVDGVSIKDVDQGHLGDCFFVASLAAVAFTHPDIIENAIHETADGHISILLWHKTTDGNYETDNVSVDKLVPAYGTSPTFAHGSTATQMWPAWMQKGYAAEASTQKGAPASYSTINNGGLPGDALAALTGKPSTSFAVNASVSSALFKSIEQAVATKHPTVAVTPGTLKDSAPVHADHTYTIMGTKVVNGQQLVTLRNPWGYSSPGNAGGDGIFDLPMSQFVQNFVSLTIGG